MAWLENATFVAKVVSKCVIGKRLEEEIRNVYRAHTGKLRKMSPSLRTCVSVIKVAHQRIKDGIWKATVAAQKMRAMRKQLERQHPGCTRYPIWAKTMKLFNMNPHLLNKANLLKMAEIEEILESCDSKRDRALFWLALLVCSRIGNLKGYHVGEVTEEMITVTPIQHKTTAGTNQMRLELYYWNKSMRKCIVKYLPRGYLTAEITQSLSTLLTKSRVRWHSVRRTAIQVYIDCGVPLDRIRAITLHKDDDTLLAYVGTIRPVLDSSKPSGMAISHAPYIWRIQNRLGRGVLRMYQSGNSMPHQ